MINVTLITNTGSGLPVRVPVVEGTTLENFLNVSFDGNPDDFTIRIRANGTTVEAHKDYVLQDEDRVSLAPKKIEGAKGPGSKEQQIEVLKTRLGGIGIANSEDIIKAYSSDEIALAYKLSRQNHELPKVIGNLLNKLPEDEAKVIRQKLLAVKN